MNALRPLGVGEILDVGIKIYFRNAGTLFRIVLFVVLPTQILVNLIQVSALPEGVSSSYTFEPTPSFTSDRTSLSGRETTTLITGFVIALLLNALAGKLAQAACFRAVTDAYLGGTLSGLVLGLAFASPAQNTATGFVLNVAATTISSMVTTPAVAAFAIVLYIDLRVRKEGFDLYLLARRLGVEPTEAGASTLLPPEPAVYADGEQPPFWPPPPGWKPSSGGTLPPVPRPEPQPEQPPFWPPPPGWKPSGGEDT